MAQTKTGSGQPLLRGIRPRHAPPRTPAARVLAALNDMQAAAAGDPSTSAAFDELLAAAGAHTTLAARPSAFCRGLFATAAAASGATLLCVPRAACLLLDYDTGLSVRDAPWPALRAGLQAPEPLPWDLLLALALVDARHGRGDPFWEAYAAQQLPAPAALTVPFCQPEDALAAVQDTTLARNAAAQKERLAALFPQLTEAADPAHGPSPTVLEWAFAAVRSRAFRVGENAFAFVPFLDMANHADAPNADFAVADDGAIELRATEDIAEGDEVIISYTGKQGATNSRLLVQYGFVQPGNPADRLDLGIVDGPMPTTPLRGQPGEAISLPLLQEHMGDGLFTGMLSGKAPALMGALKSIPTHDASDLSPETREREALFVAHLLKALRVVESDFTTSIAEDEELLQRGDLSEWQRVAITYRLERKQLAKAAGSVLRIYQRVASD